MLRLNRDPAHLRVGINLGSLEEEAVAAKLAVTFHELLSRLLNLARVGIVAAPILVQSCYLNDVDFGPWLFRLLSIYAIGGVAAALVAPEQAFNGLALRKMRWLFQLLHPEAVTWNGSLADAQDAQPSLLQGETLKELGGAVVRLRWHGTHKYLCLTDDGWAAAGEEASAATLLMQRLAIKGEQIPDTYTFCVSDAGARWDKAFLSFSPVNQLRLGGWMGAFFDIREACPYKLVRDSSCPIGAVKLLCAWPLRLQENYGGRGRRSPGFYVAEQRSGGHLFVGHGPDVDAALLEVIRV